MVSAGRGARCWDCGCVDPGGVVYTVFIDGTKMIRRVCLLDLVAVAPRGLLCWDVAVPLAVLVPPEGLCVVAREESAGPVEDYFDKASTPIARML